MLIHGWLSKRADLAAVARAFRTSHRVVSIDLPGHGESEVPEDESRLRIPSFADDVAALCDELGLSGAALVGHSLGAAVAVELAVRRPELAAAVVALDGVVLMPSALLEGFAPLLAALRSPAWREALGGLLTSTFLPTDDPDLLRSLLADIDQMPQHVAAAVAEHMTDWDAESAVAALGRSGTPVLAIDATGLSDLERFATLAPQLTVGKVVGVGHDQMLATPAQSVAMIQRFLYTPRSAAVRSITLRRYNSCLTRSRPATWASSTRWYPTTSLIMVRRPARCHLGRKATRRRCDCYARPCR